MLIEWVKRHFGGRVAPGPSRWLDDLLDEIAGTRSLERRKALWAEVTRRFIHDVERACRIAGVENSQERASSILDEALRRIGCEPAKCFSRELVRIMKRHLGDSPVRKVLRSLYLRQFLAELPARLVPYAEGFLDQEGHIEWLADRQYEDVEEVRERCREAWGALPRAVEKEYDNEEVVERTDGVWTILKLKERDEP